MTVQHIVLVGGYPDGQWCCGLCGAGLTNGTITHRDDCRFTGKVREAQREDDARLAEQHGAYYHAEPRPCTCRPGCAIPKIPKMPFADLLRRQSQ